jgi:hypothetical protein
MQIIKSGTGFPFPGKPFLLPVVMYNAAPAAFRCGRRIIHYDRRIKSVKKNINYRNRLPSFPSASVSALPFSLSAFLYISQTVQA